MCIQAEMNSSRCRRSHCSCSTKAACSMIISALILTRLAKSRISFGSPVIPTIPTTCC
ncbi:Uncharacterised protein [Vibrio cholerae]|nr:Uncharacterised protein [Vibrio cholerae]